MAEEPALETVLVETHGAVGLLRINRPAARNALNEAVMVELGRALQRFDADPEIRAIVLTGDAKAFAAGADIAEMRDKGFSDAFGQDFITATWETIQTVRTPVIAAVAGYALGGGCELAMSCDLIIAAETAQFGLPEVTLGIIPGAGGTQRLARYIGKAKAMEMVLTGRFMGAEEAERSGLVARVTGADDLVPEALKTASRIASLPGLAILAAKESVNRSFETSLREGVLFERRLLHALFATDDQKEGMAAFVEKRPANFRHR